MKIAAVRAHCLASDLETPFAFSQGWVKRRGACIVEVQTDAGITGWGEALCQGLQPLAASVNMHPIHFAIIGIVSLAFGLVTPPYGMCLMIACAVARVRLRYALKDTMIMLIPMLAVLMALIAWPELVLWLPRLVAPELLK